ncbi:hypothetical protein DFP73DRAFT_555140 [Morchella snyderi]|nr:hypothetical protein DFP73DRAFT_555140 [Morchella snyderi]
MFVSSLMAFWVWAELRLHSIHLWLLVRLVVSFSDALDRSGNNYQRRSVHSCSPAYELAFRNQSLVAQPGTQGWPERIQIYVLVWLWPLELLGVP